MPEPVDEMDAYDRQIADLEQIPVVPVASYPTRGGHAVEVYGPDPWGGYSDHCTGCNSRTSSEDVPADQAEAAMRRSAEYHAKFCWAGAPLGPFTPTRDDMDSELYGLLVSPLGGEYGDGEMIAVGLGLTSRRALAAFAAYARHNAWGLPEQLRTDLAAGWTVAICPTQFTRESNGGWTAHPHTEGAPPAAWLVPPHHPAAAKACCTGPDRYWESCSPDCDAYDVAELG